MRRVAILLSLVFSLALAAQESIVADRPGFADGSSTVGAGVFQAEAGLNVDDQDDSVLSFPTLLRWGLTDALELRIESDVARITGGDGEIASVAAGFKLRLREGSMPLSLLASIDLPSGEGDSATTDFGTEVRLVADLDLGGGLSLTPNVGISVPEGGPAGAVFAASLGKEMGAFGPFVDFELRTGGDETTMVIDGGVAWIVRSDTQLDVAGGATVVGDETPDWFLTAGISRRF